MHVQSGSAILSQDLYLTENESTLVSESEKIDENIV